MEGNYPMPQEAPAPAPEPLFNQLLQRGREGKSESWRYFVGVLLSFLGGYVLLGQLPLTLLIFYDISQHYFSLADLAVDSAKILNAETLHVSTNTLIVFFMFIFVASMAGLWIAVRFIHRRPFMSVISGVSNKFDFKRYFFAFGLWTLVCVGQVLLSLKLNPVLYTYVFNPVPFFVGAIILIILLPIQTGWEEIFMRGYLMQMLGGWFKKSIWPWIITSVIFGLLHSMNEEVQSNGFFVMMPQYILPGFVFGAIALMDQRLELSMGMHFAHNLIGLLAITSPDTSIHANAIWEIPSLASTLTDAIYISILYLVPLTIFYRVYRWDIKKLYK
jgi:membrane protease YdiL (CAAX protease family)